MEVSDELIENVARAMAVGAFDVFEPRVQARYKDMARLAYPLIRAAVLDDVRAVVPDLGLSIFQESEIYDALDELEQL